jgi:hypothetical protein
MEEMCSVALDAGHPSPAPIPVGECQEFVEKLHSMKILSEGAILCGADRICAPEYKMAPKMERSWGFLRRLTSNRVAGCSKLL